MSIQILNFLLFFPILEIKFLFTLNLFNMRITCLFAKANEYVCYTCAELLMSIVNVNINRDDNLSGSGLRKRN